MARVHLGVDDDEGLVAAPAADDKFAAIPVDQIQPNPENPRPPNEDVNEAAADLAARGQLHNLNVMTKAAFIEQKPYLAAQLNSRPFVAVNGVRRWLAATKAGLPSLKAVVRDEWTENDIDEAVVTENEHRAKVNHLMLGRHLNRMLPRYGSHHKLAKALNKTQPWVSQHIGLTNLHPHLQEAVLVDRLPFKLTRECTRLHEDLQPLLASGDLPEEVATVWLLELRLSKDEQLARWKAGPPFLDDHQATSSDDADVRDDPVPDKSKTDETPRKARPIVIRIREWSAPTVVTHLRKQLTDDQWAELVDEITRSR